MRHTAAALTPPATTGPSALAERAIDSLSATDPTLYQLLSDDLLAQASTLSLLASAGLAPPSVLACAGSAVTNTAAEGTPGRRFQAGCAVVDEIEQLATHRAMTTFGAGYANVQPHSGGAANLSVYFGLLSHGDPVLVPDESFAGRRLHGTSASVIAKYFTTLTYGLDGVGRVDYARVRALAERSKPKLIVCVAGASPRVPDFARFRAIADEVGAYLLVDISDAAGLIAAGAHPNPIDHAHVTTTCTGRQLCGPRGGLILLGKDADVMAPGSRDSLRALVRNAVVPLIQGAPNTAAMAAKARAMQHVSTPQFRQLARRIVVNAKAVAARLLDRGYDVVSYGTDNHLVLLNVMSEGMTGAVAERALESCGILTSRHRLPFDVKPPLVGSGITLATTVPATRGMAVREMDTSSRLIDAVLSSVIPQSDAEFRLPDRIRLRVRDEVGALCRNFPLPRYPTSDHLSGGYLAEAS